MNKVYGISFKDNGKVYYFKTKDNFNNNDLVIIETEKGLQLGKIVSEQTDKKVLERSDDFKSILRAATDKDYKDHLNNLKQADRALKKAVELASQLQLDMKVVSANFTFDKKQLIINFLADDRVDFRELAKSLANIYHTRIELRQIGPRDKAKEIGGIGPCGQQLCCTRFLKQIESVSMNMAKNQNLALNPSKINGACGRLFCCLSYEDDEYTRCAKNMPYLGQTIKTKYGSGTVTNVDILNRRYTVDIDGTKKEIELENDEKSNK